MAEPIDRSSIGPRGTWVRIVRALALLSMGLLAGAFGYGTVNVVQTLKAVPLDVRLTFHTALMRMNGPVMQTTMALAIISSLVLSIVVRKTARLLAATASALAFSSFLVTRFGNVPINSQIKVWAVTSAPPDHAAILHRWEMFNNVRTAAALAAFVLLLIAVDITLPTSASSTTTAAVRSVGSPGIGRSRWFSRLWSASIGLLPIPRRGAAPLGPAHRGLVGRPARRR